MKQFIPVLSLLFFSASSAFAINCPNAQLACAATDLASGQLVDTRAARLEAQNDDEPSEPEYADKCVAYLSLNLSTDRKTAFTVTATYRNGANSILVSTASLVCNTVNVGPCYFDTQVPNDSQEYALQVGQSLNTDIKKFGVRLNCQLQP